MTIEAVKLKVASALAGPAFVPIVSSSLANDESNDPHRNAPQPSQECFYGLVGEVAQSGSESTEANPYAIGLNLLSYLSAAIGRGPYLPVGNTWHHARLFTLHVGRSGRGRKGDACNLVHRIDRALRTRNELIAPQVHRGGLSTREGLALMIHDGFTEGKNKVEPIDDKRLIVFESEFANILHQGKRDGNTLSTALRDAWDGVSLRPATKNNRIWASNPHIALAGGITPSELKSLLATRELTNGFANRFLMIWAERTKILPFPRATPQPVVDTFAERIEDVLRFAGADMPLAMDCQRVTFTAAAESFYGKLYLAELNDQSAGETLNALLERRAPVLLRLAMIFALSDLTRVIDVQHLNAALAWIRYWHDSVKYIFATSHDETAAELTNEAAQKIFEFLGKRKTATRTEISRECFQAHLPKPQIDAALDELLSASPPAIVVEAQPRTKDQSGPTVKFYRLAAKSAKGAKSEH